MEIRAVIMKNTLRECRSEYVRWYFRIPDRCAGYFLSPHNLRNEAGFRIEIIEVLIGEENHAGNYPVFFYTFPDVG